MGVLAATRNLISIDEALRLVLERVERSAGRDPVVRRGSWAGCSPRTRAPPSICRRSTARRWTVSRCARPTRPGRLPVSFRIAAGSPAPRALEPGEAMGIATGGVVPAGADAVIPFEYVVESDNTIAIENPVEVGANIRPAGGDIRVGETVVEAGTRLGPAQLAALAAAGIAEVHVARRPRAAVARDRKRAAPAGRAARRRGRSTRRTGCCSRRQLESAGAEVERLGLGRRRRGRPPRRRLRAGSRPTFSSPPAASRSARTTSCGRSRPSSASRRSSGASR